MSEVTKPRDDAYAQVYMPTLIALHLTNRLASMSQRLIETNAAPLDANSQSGLVSDSLKRVAANERPTKWLHN